MTRCHLTYGNCIESSHISSPLTRSCTVRCADQTIIVLSSFARLIWLKTSYSASISYVDLPRTQPKQSTQSMLHQTILVNLGYFRTREPGEGSTGGTAKPTNDVIK